MPTLNSWLVPLQSLLKLTGHCPNHCIWNTPGSRSGHTISSREKTSHEWYLHKCLCLKLPVPQCDDTHTVNPEMFSRVIVTLQGWTVSVLTSPDYTQRQAPSLLCCKLKKKKKNKKTVFQLHMALVVLKITIGVKTTLICWSWLHSFCNNYRKY